MEIVYVGTAVPYNSIIIQYYLYAMNGNWILISCLDQGIPCTIHSRVVTCYDAIFLYITRHLTTTS